MVDKVLADWAWLPTDLLDSIVGRMDELSDFIMFSLVCKPWHAIAQKYHIRQQLLQLVKTCRNQMPMLLTSTNDNSNDRSLYSITEGSVYHIKMPMSCNRRFSGSSEGWLFMVDKSMNITLINPFLNKTVALPKFKVPGLNYWYKYNGHDDHDYYIKKAILLPGGKDFEVLLIFSGMHRLAYLKSRDAPWKCITLKANFKANFKVQMFNDIICYKGQIYAVSFYSALVRIDVKTGACKIVIAATNIFAHTTYLVESQDGDLLLVRRFLKASGLMHVTRKILVYKLWEDGRKSKWVRIKRIGEQALFLGTNYSMSISTQKFPQCKSNCIYYVDDYHLLGYTPYANEDEDDGIYNMEDRSFSKHYVPDSSFCPSQPPIWIVPKLKKVDNNTTFNLDSKFD